MSSTYTNLIYHIVYSTKCRRPIIERHDREELYRYIGGIIRANQGILLEIGGMPDHVHILAKLTPKLAVTDVLRLVKTNSSKWLNERPSRKGRFGWQTGYAAFSVSQSQLPVVTRYIRNQEKHHQKQTFLEEYLALLTKHQIEFEDRFVFEEEYFA